MADAATGAGIHAYTQSANCFQVSSCVDAPEVLSCFLEPGIQSTLGTKIISPSQHTYTNHHGTRIGVPPHEGDLQRFDFVCMYRCMHACMSKIAFLHV